MNIADHYPVYLSIACKKNSNIPRNNADKTMTKTKFDIKQFNNLLKQKDWSEVTVINCPREAYLKFINEFTGMYNKCKTVIIVKITQRKKLKPWITEGIINSIKYRDKLKKTMIKDRTNLELKNNYKEYRNILNKVICNTKSKYYSNKINENQNDMKNLYKLVGEATNECNRKNPNLLINKDNGESFLTDKEMVDYCNEYFINIGSKMAECIEEPQQKLEDNYPNIPHLIFLRPVNENEIVEHIATLKTICAPGYDDISTKLVKDNHKHLLEPITHIINLIFITGKIPKQFKESVVSPIFKQGNKGFIKNYRPISLITTFAKIFEKCLKSRLYDHLKRHNILSSKQYGFLPKTSKSDAMFDVVNLIKNNLDKGDKCIAVFLDLAKAFDTVHH